MVVNDPFCNTMLDPTKNYVNYLNRTWLRLGKTSFFDYLGS